MKQSEFLVEVRREALTLQAAKALRDWGDGCCILPLICVGTRSKVPQTLILPSLQSLLEIF